MAKKPSLNEVDPSKAGVSTGGPPPTHPVNPQTGETPSPPAEQPKKKRGRPPKAPAFQIDPKTVEPMCDWPFNFMAGRWGSHWKLSKDERTQLADALVPVANKYMPGILEKFGEEIVLFFVLFGIVGSKAAQGFDMKLPVPPRDGGTDRQAPAKP